MLGSMTAVVSTVLSTAMVLSSPASTIEIRREPQPHTVTPAMMRAIDTIMAEKIRMSHMRHGAH